MGNSTAASPAGSSRISTNIDAAQIRRFRHCVDLSQYEQSPTVYDGTRTVPVEFAMYSHLLVPTDGSKLSDKAVAHAAPESRDTAGI